MMPATKTAVHLVGCQRSGTDMCIYLLDRNLDVDRFNENHPAAFDKCRVRSHAMIAQLIEKSRASCVVFKPICDSHRVTEILNWHKPSRAVWLYRDYRDVARSTMAMWGDANLRHLRDLITGGGDWGWSQWNRDGYTPDLLQEVGDLVNDELTPQGAAALYWYLRNRSYFTQRLGERDDVTIFRYRDLVTNPVEHFARMCEFIGLTFSDEMAAAVHARSVSKGRDIALDPRITELCEGLLTQLDAEVQRCAAEGQS
jgi:hypothetical protein